MSTLPIPSRPMLPPIICWGEVLWDRFPDGSQLGGAVANVAWHLAMLGAPVALVTRVGDDDDGREATRRLAARGVDTSLVQIDPARATGVVEVTTVLGEPKYTLVPGRAWEQLEASAPTLAAIEAAPAFVYGTLAQRAGLDTWRAAVTAAKGLKVCDPNLRPGKEDRDAVAAALQIADVV
jgi:fructokinase